MDQGTHSKIVSFPWGILAVQREAEGLLDELVQGGAK
jgi:hypothetical protein